MHIMNNAYNMELCVKKYCIQITLKNQLMVAIDFHSIFFPTMEVNGCPKLVCLTTFFKISSFVFNRRKKLIQVRNNLRVSK